MPIFIHVPWLPSGIGAITLWFLVFWKGDTLHESLKTHETIHYWQGVELGFVFFTLLYVLEFLYHFVHKWKYWDSYLAISFEREAYDNDSDPEYLDKREWYAWRKYWSKRKDDQPNQEELQDLG